MLFTRDKMDKGLFLLTSCFCGFLALVASQLFGSRGVEVESHCDDCKLCKLCVLLVSAVLFVNMFLVLGPKEFMNIESLNLSKRGDACKPMPEVATQLRSQWRSLSKVGLEAVFLVQSSSAVAEVISRPFQFRCPCHST